MTSSWTGSIPPALGAFAGVLLVSLVSLAGLATLSLSEVRLRRTATFFVSFAVGALLGDAFIHLVPEIFEGSQGGPPVRRSLLILGGMLVFFVVEKLLRHRHGVLHDRQHPEHAVAHPGLAAVNVLGDAIHNFIDGVLIGASWIASPALGVTTTLAVFLHEIPQELGDFGVLVHSGLGVRRAILVNLGSASLAIAGTASVILLGPGVRDAAAVTLLPVTAGGFIYLAAADLIPELQHDHSLRALLVQTLLISTGIAVMVAIGVFEPA